MLGILICGHGRFGEGLIEAAEMLCGPQPYLQALNIDLSDDLELCRQRLGTQIAAWQPDTDEILCLCDMQGGFPMEVCLVQLPDQKVKIITEATLTLLTYLLVHRNGSQSVQQLVNNALLEAKEAIHVIDPQILFADQRGEES